MAKDDFDVIQFKVLSYLYRCAKDGVRPVPAKAREFAGVNDVYFEAVMEDLLDCKYAACSVRGFPPCPLVMLEHPQPTYKSGYNEAKKCGLSTKAQHHYARRKAVGVLNRYYKDVMPMYGFEYVTRKESYEYNR